MKDQELNSAESVGIIAVRARVRPGEGRRIVAQAREHSLVMDMREEMGGENSGPTPPEFLAMALGGCLVNIARIMAEQKGIGLKGLEVEVSGGIDPSRAMGLDVPGREGFISLDVRVGLETDLAGEARREFGEELARRCALCDTIANATPLNICVE